MRNLSTVDEAADVPTKTYVDLKVEIGTVEPTDPATEIWIDTN